LIDVPLGEYRFTQFNTATRPSGSATETVVPITLNVNSLGAGAAGKERDWLEQASFDPSAAQSTVASAVDE
jgi:hypothetical protein